MDALIRCPDNRRFRRDLQRDDLVGIPARGVRSPSTEFDHATLVAAQQLASTRVAVACDLSAAHLWGLPVPAAFGLDVDAQTPAIATVRDGSRHRATGVRGRRLELPNEHVGNSGGVALTTPARTWLDCAAVVPPPAVMAMGDGILAGRLASERELEDIVGWGRGRRGVAIARLLLPWLDGRVESPGESWLRYSLIARGFPKPAVNPQVVLRSGRVVRLDIAWVEERVAAEYDGREHHGEDARSHDEQRREELADDGWTVVAFRAESLIDPHLLGLVRQALMDRGATFWSGLPLRPQRPFDAWPWLSGSGRSRR